MSKATDQQLTLPAILITAAAAITVTLLLYRHALPLALWADDLLQVPWVLATPLPQLWRTVSPYQDYRPLHFSLWRGVYLLTGALTPATLHLLNLIGHALSSFLVGALAARITTRKLSAALLGMSFFALFPFAYDTVLWVSSFSYPLALSLTLGALWLYLQARTTRHNALHIPALLCTALAGFAYEGGVMAGASVLWAEICFHQRPFSRWSLAYLGAAILPFAAITAVSPAVPTEFLTGLHPAYNLIIALQCLIYPLAPLAELLARLTNISANPLLVLIALGVIGGMAFLGYRKKTLRPALFGLGWALMWSIIPLATQAFNWYRDPPRVFYLSAVGIALLWATILESLPPMHWKPHWRHVAQGVLSLALLMPGVAFLRDEIALHQHISELLWAAAREAETHPNTLFINLPGRITFPTRRYPLGHEGAIPLPPPTNGELWFAVHGQSDAGATARALGAILPPTPYLLELADADVEGADLRTAARIVQVRYRADSLSLETIGQVIPEQAPPARALATFNSPAGQMLLVRRAACRWIGPTEIALEIEWQTLSKLAGAPTVFVHLWSADGALLAQADGDPLRGLYPLAEWEAREIVRETRVLENAITAGTVTLGVWEPDSGARWQVAGSDGELLADPFLTLECE